MWELFFSWGGHAGPYNELSEAIEAALSRLTNIQYAKIEIRSRVGGDYINEDSTRFFILKTRKEIGLFYMMKDAKLRRNFQEIWRRPLD